MNKKRILILHHSTKISGAERSLLDFLGAVSKNKRYQYHFYVGCPERGRLPEKLNELGIEVIEIPLLRLKRSYNPYILLRYIFRTAYLTLYLRKIILKKKLA